MCAKMREKPGDLREKCAMGHEELRERHAQVREMCAINSTGKQTGSGRVCAVCTHPQRTAIDDALRQGMTQAETARLFRLSRHSVNRHALRHLGQPNLEEVAQALADPQALQHRYFRLCVRFAVQAEERAAGPELDGKERELELNGRVRRQDIGFDNRVSSDRIADAVVKVDGATAAAGRSGFGIFDFLLAPFH